MLLQFLAPLARLSVLDWALLALGFFIAWTLTTRWAQVAAFFAHVLSPLRPALSALWAIWAPWLRSSTNWSGVILFVAFQTRQNLPPDVIAAGAGMAVNVVAMLSLLGVWIGRANASGPIIPRARPQAAPVGTPARGDDIIAAEHGPAAFAEHVSGARLQGLLPREGFAATTSVATERYPGELASNANAAEAHRQALFEQFSLTPPTAAQLAGMSMRELRKRLQESSVRGDRPSLTATRRIEAEIARRTSSPRKRARKSARVS